MALAVFLDTWIDVVEGLDRAEPWLAPVVDDWKLAKSVNDYELRIPAMSPDQRAKLVVSLERACVRLERRVVVPAAHLRVRGIAPRGDADVKVAPIVELGHALAALVSGALPEPPVGTAWLYGAPSGRTTVAMRAP